MTLCPQMPGLGSENSASGSRYFSFCNDRLACGNRGASRRLLLCSCQEVWFGVRVVSWFAAVSPTEPKHLSGPLFDGVLGLGLWGFPSSAFSDSKGEQSWVLLWKVSGTPYCPHLDPLPGLPPLSVPPAPARGREPFLPPTAG